MTDYSRALIYKITSNVTGSTTSTLGIRKSEHRKMAATQDRPLLRAIGSEHFFIHLVEAFPCANKFHLEQREFEVIKAYPEEQQFPASRSKFDLDPKYRRGKIYLIT
jgi:hypothetical protein